MAVPPKGSRWLGFSRLSSQGLETTAQRRLAAGSAQKPKPFTTRDLGKLRCRQRAAEPLKAREELGQVSRINTAAASASQSLGLTDQPALQI